MQKVLARPSWTSPRGEELLFSDAGAVIATRSPAGEATAPTSQQNAGQPEVPSGIQGKVLLVTVSHRPASGRLT